MNVNGNLKESVVFNVIQGCDIRYRVTSAFHSSFLVLAQLCRSFRLPNRRRAMIKLYSYNRTKCLMPKRSNSCMNTLLVSLQQYFISFTTTKIIPTSYKYF